MTRIVPLTDLCDTARMMELSESEPVFITVDGKASRVLMNLETYEAARDILLDIELEQRLRRSEEEGGDVDAHGFFRTFLL